MADRRTDDTSVAPSRDAATAPSAQDTQASGRPVDAPKAAGSSKGTGSERFAAAVAKVRDVQKPGRDRSGSGGSTAASRPAAAKPVRRVRRARLRLTHIDPWSVMKTSFLLSIAIGIVTVVAVGIVWSVLGVAGVWDSINQAVADVAGDSGNGFDIQDYLGTSRIMGITMLLAVVDVFLITVVATLGAFLYNLAAALLGGLEVVFAEEDR